MHHAVAWQPDSARLIPWLGSLHLKHLGARYHPDTVFARHLASLWLRYDCPALCMPQRLQVQVRDGWAYGVGGEAHRREEPAGANSARALYVCGKDVDQSGHQGSRRFHLIVPGSTCLGGPVGGSGRLSSSWDGMQEPVHVAGGASSSRLNFLLDHSRFGTLPKKTVNGSSTCLQPVPRRLFQPAGLS